VEMNLLFQGTSIPIPRPLLQGRAAFFGDYIRDFPRGAEINKDAPDDAGWVAGIVGCRNRRLGWSEAETQPTCYASTHCDPTISMLPTASFPRKRTAVRNKLRHLELLQTVRPELVEGSPRSGVRTGEPIPLGASVHPSTSSGRTDERAAVNLRLRVFCQIQKLWNSSALQPSLRAES
jgi:hypothetical protein